MMLSKLSLSQYNSNKAQLFLRLATSTSTSTRARHPQAQVLSTLRRLSSAAPKAAAAAASTTKWSQGLSYASPESDFTSSAIYVSANSATMESEWSQQLRFASPESDFTSATATASSSQTKQQQLQQQEEMDMMLLQMQLWSNPETATGYTHVAERMDADTKHDFAVQVQKQTGLAKRSATQMQMPKQEKTKECLAAAEEEEQAPIRMMHQVHPDSALGVVHVAEFLTKQEQQQLKALTNDQEQDTAPMFREDVQVNDDADYVDNMMKHRQLNSPESATGNVPVTEFMTSEEKAQFGALLQKQQEQEQPLPHSMQEALADQQRAIVITKPVAPFEVVNVNECWEGLCGFTRKEAQQRPIGELLKGPGTELERARRIMARLVQEPAETYDVNLINYTKAGRKFYNHLHVGTMVDQNTGDKFFVGVLEEMNAKTQSNMSA